MSVIQSPASAPTTYRPWWRPLPRWLVSFVGFPLGGFTAIVLTGPVDGLGPALVGGLVTGGVLGAVQAWAMGTARPSVLGWVVATAVGLMTGLGLGSWLVDYQTGLGHLVVQGLVCGAFVGLAQAPVLLPRLGAIALLWPVYLGAVWAIGWAVTTSLGISVKDQFTVFGSGGAVVATLLTAVLPALLHHSHSVRNAR